MCKACGKLKRWLATRWCAAWVRNFFSEVVRVEMWTVVKFPGCRLFFPGFGNLRWLQIFCKIFNPWIFIWIQAVWCGRLNSWRWCGCWLKYLNHRRLRNRFHPRSWYWYSRDNLKLNISLWACGSSGGKGKFCKRGWDVLLWKMWVVWLIAFFVASL